MRKYLTEERYNWACQTLNGQQKKMETDLNGRQKKRQDRGRGQPAGEWGANQHQRSDRSLFHSEGCRKGINYGEKKRAGYSLRGVGEGV